LDVIFWSSLKLPHGRGCGLNRADVPKQGIMLDHFGTGIGSNNRASSGIFVHEHIVAAM
jgi:hypothetical protein